MSYVRSSHALESVDLEEQKFSSVWSYNEVWTENVVETVTVIVLSQFLDMCW